MTDKFSIHAAQDTMEDLLDGKETVLPTDLTHAYLEQVLFLLDELMRLHNQLDLYGVPGTNLEGEDLNLRERISRLADSGTQSRPVHQDSFGKPIQPEPKQYHLF